MRIVATVLWLGALGWALAAARYPNPWFLIPLAAFTVAALLTQLRLAWSRVDDMIKGDDPL